MSVGKMRTWYPLLGSDRMPWNTDRKSYMSKVNELANNSTQKSIDFRGTGSLYYNLTESSGPPINNSPEAVQLITDLSIFWSTTTPVPWNAEHVCVSFWYMLSSSTFAAGAMVDIRLNSSTATPSNQWLSIIPINYNSSTSNFGSVQLCIKTGSTCEAGKIQTVAMTLQLKHWYFYQVYFSRDYFVPDATALTISL
jgi:hypothetical protein